MSLRISNAFPQTFACQHGVLALNLYNWLWALDFGSRKQRRVFQELCSAVDIFEYSLFKTLLWPPPKFQKRSASTWSLRAYFQNVVVATARINTSKYIKIRQPLEPSKSPKKTTRKCLRVGLSLFGGRAPVVRFGEIP